MFSHFSLALSFAEFFEKDGERERGRARHISNYNELDLVVQFDVFGLGSGKRSGGPVVPNLILEPALIVLLLSKTLSYMSCLEGSLQRDELVSQLVGI